jgi:hypothetical protein
VEPNDKQRREEMKRVMLLAALIGLLFAPLMSYASPVTEAKAVLSTIAGRSLTTTQLVRIADAFVWMNADLVPEGVDPATMTNNQKATVVLLALRVHVRQTVRSVADSKSRAASRATAEVDAEAAAVAAEADIN